MMLTPGRVGGIGFRPIAKARAMACGSKPRALPDLRASGSSSRPRRSQRKRPGRYLCLGRRSLARATKPWIGERSWKQGPGSTSSGSSSHCRHRGRGGGGGGSSSSSRRRTSSGPCKEQKKGRKRGEVGGEGGRREGGGEGKQENRQGGVPRVLGGAA